MYRRGPSNGQPVQTYTSLATSAHGELRRRISSGHAREREMKLRARVAPAPRLRLRTASASLEPAPRRPRRRARLQLNQSSMHTRESGKMSTRERAGSASNHARVIFASVARYSRTFRKRVEGKKQMIIKIFNGGVSLCPDFRGHMQQTNHIENNRFTQPREWEGPRRKRARAGLIPSYT